MPHDHLMKKIRLIVIAILWTVFSFGIISQPSLRAESEPAEPEQTSNIWSSPTSLSDILDAKDAEDPDLAICPLGIIFVVWEQEGEIWYRVFKPGSGWGPANPIYSDGLNGRGEDPAIAATSDCTFYLVWSQPLLWGGREEIIYTVSEGDQFLRLPTNVSRTSEFSSSKPDIVIDSNDMPYVVWREQTEAGLQLYGGKKIEGSTNFTRDSIFTYPLNKSINTPSLAIDAMNRLHLTWIEAPSVRDIPNISYRWQVEPGEWAPGDKYILNLGTPGRDSRLPDVAASHQKVVVTWQEKNPDGNYEIFARAASLDMLDTPAGPAFSTPFNLSQSSTSSRSPAISVDGLGRFFVVWDEGGPVDAVLLRSWLGTGNWGGIGTIANNGTQVKQPTIVSSPKDNKLYAVWAQLDTPEGTWDIYMSSMEPVLNRFYLTPIMKQYGR